MNKKGTISFADIETTAFSEVFDSERIEQMDFRLGCVITYDDNMNELEREHYTDVKEFCKKLNNLNIVYFHNLAFDFKFIQKDLLDLNTKFTPVITGNSLLCAKFFKFKQKREAKTVELRDSLAILKSSVKNLGNNIDLPKIVIENQEFENVEYCFRDCEIVAYSLFRLREWLKTFFQYDIKMTKFPLTIASLSKKVFLSIYPNAFYQHDFKIYEKARKYYYGGRTEVFNFNRLINGVVLDVVSLYPSMCCEYKFPNAATAWFEFDNTYSIEQILTNHRHTQNNYIIGFECEIIENQKIPLYPSRIDDKVVFLNGKKEIFMTIYEYEYLKKKGFIGSAIEIIRVKAVALAADITDFKDFFIPLAEMKQKTTDKAERWFDKLFMNSITGKFGQKPDRIKTEYFNESEIKENQDFYYDIDLDCSYNQTKSIQKFQTTNLLTIISITNLARFTLWKQLIKVDKANKNYYYCDTDSISVDKDALELFNLGNNLGQWNVEYNVKEYQAIDSKEYLFINSDDQSTIKFKGLITSHLQKSDFYQHYTKGTITRLIPKNRYCTIRKIPNESVVFLKKEKRHFYFKRIIKKDLTTVALTDKNLSISNVKKHNRDIIMDYIIKPNLIAAV